MDKGAILANLPSPQNGQKVIFMHLLARTSQKRQENFKFPLCQLEMQGIEPWTTSMLKRYYTTGLVSM